MKVQVIQVPFDSGFRGVRMGAGPEHLLHRGLKPFLINNGYDGDVETIEPENSFRAEIKTAFELHRQLAARVRYAYDHGSFPLVLSGNCNSSLGTLSGIGGSPVGIIWFDAHGDFNTPETTESGFLDGMGLATAAGLCWQKMAASIPHFKPVPPKNILHVGSRDFGRDEKAALENSGGAIVDAKVIRSSRVRTALEGPLTDLASRVSRVYLHFDLDVLDPATAAANEFAMPDGLTLAHLDEAIAMIAERFTISALAIASYDPSYDKNGEVLKCGISIVQTVLDNVRARLEVT